MNRALDGPHPPLANFANESITAGEQLSEHWIEIRRVNVNQLRAVAGTCVCSIVIRIAALRADLHVCTVKVT